FVRLCVLFSLPAGVVIYTLSLHDALPISGRVRRGRRGRGAGGRRAARVPRGQAAPGAAGRGRGRVRIRRLRAPSDRDRGHARGPDRKSTRLNSSHVKISYAVFCLKKKQLR